nr:hypothetical protein [Tanacetum cinerariifolium]
VVLVESATLGTSCRQNQLIQDSLPNVVGGAAKAHYEGGGTTR